ncbi:tetratricopeptide repeat protein [Alphaproteobacteria bacterium LSUCC0719]
MTRFIATTTVTNGARSFHPPLSAFLDMRGWMAVLFVAASLLGAGTTRTFADAEPAGEPRNIATASLETGIIAARAGRLRDAITILNPHADRGNPTANYVLGLIYRQDRGALASRPTLSHRHFARAAAAGHVASIFEAASQFERGIGTTRDVTKAIQLYRFAARANHTTAQFNLAVLLSHDKAKQADLRQAYFWAIMARNNAVRRHSDALPGSRIIEIAKSIRSRIPHQLATQASAAAARLTGQPV